MKIRGTLQVWLAIRETIDQHIGYGFNTVIDDPELIKDTINDTLVFNEKGYILRPGKLTDKNKKNRYSVPYNYLLGKEPMLEFCDKIIKQLK